MDETSLDLAIVESCNDLGCRVRPLDGRAAFQAAYSAQVLNVIKIRPGQLVVIDLQAAPPEVLWRWYRMEVTSVGPDNLVLDDRGLRQVLAGRIAGFAAELVSGDLVWVGGAGPGHHWEAIDQVSPQGGVSQPDRVRTQAFSLVLAFYNGLAA